MTRISAQPSPQGVSRGFRSGAAALCAAVCLAIVLFWILAPTPDAPSGAPPSSARPRPIVGALRWDAWHSVRGVPGLAVEKTLSPRHWHDRLPFYARVTGEDEAIIDAASPKVMRREIEYAAGAGLDYWAFVTYPPDDPMSLGLSLYLQSEQRERIDFCLILQGGWMARDGPEALPRKIDRYVSLFGQPTYQTVLGGRPLVFLFDAEGLVKPSGFSDWQMARAALARLREATREAGLENPYIVAQAFSPRRAEEYREQLQLDAIGSYAVAGGSPEGAPYDAIRKRARAFWEGARGRELELVPLVSTGWDKRPRAENPVPWEKRRVLNYYQPPRPEELAGHLRDALGWMDEHPSTVPARALLIYAWNEFDEGGWLAPTLSEGTARLDAIRSVLAPPQPTR